MIDRLENLNYIDLLQTIIDDFNEEYNNITNAESIKK